MKDLQVLDRASALIDYGTGERFYLLFVSIHNRDLSYSLSHSHPLIQVCIHTHVGKLKFQLEKRKVTFETLCLFHIRVVFNA